MEKPAAVVGETRCGPEYADDLRRADHRQMRSSSFWAMSGAD
jgi:hypothetical protein